MLAVGGRPFRDENHRTIMDPEVTAAVMPARSQTYRGRARRSSQNTCESVEVVSHSPQQKSPAEQSGAFRECRRAVYFLRRLNASPARPMLRSAQEPGSGTGAAITPALPCRFNVS